MAETNRGLAPILSHQQQQPPPAPPLPPQKPSVLQRFIAFPAFSRPPRQQGNHAAQSNSASPKDSTSHERPYRRPTARNAVHRTSISIAAIDINDDKTHAILAGRDILKTVQVQDRTVVEALNIRNTVTNYLSTQQLRAEEIRKRRDFLPTKDVRWSHGTYSHVIATAAQNGRIALYDVSTGRSSVELAWLFKHQGQVNKLDFDPFQGYMLLSGSQDKFCKIWDIRDPRNPLDYNQYNIKAPVRDVRWSPTNVFEFALCTEAGVVQKWDVRNLKYHVLSINAHSKSCYTIAWHPDGRHLASGGIDKLLRIWDMKSELKGQKHLVQLRAPHGIMNLAWRPPSWSAEFAKRGSWQTCHIATSYTDEDPRVHVWDLRRPLLPFRELSNYETRPYDMLWADKDLLWTAGAQGIFAQSDMSYAYQVEDSLPPGAVEWCPDGSFYAVVENRTTQRRMSLTDPSAVFLNIPQDKLSGVEDGTASRSWTDDEGADMSLLEQRRISRSATGKSKSHPNTPPANDNQLKALPLEHSLVGKRELFVNGQVGALSRIPGMYTPAPVVEFIANNYTKPMTERERNTNPGKILTNLKDAFLHNAKVCQAAEMEDTASNWVLMAEVIVPELKTWADHHRRRRLLDAEDSKAKVSGESKENGRDSLSTFSKHTTFGKDPKSPARSEKVISHLFRGVVDSHRGSSDNGSHGGSNMTTPRQQPAASPSTTSRKDGSIWFTLDDAIEPIQPLPPSIANAHSTAAAASRTLLESPSEPNDSPMSSPERPRVPTQSLRGHRRSATETATSTMNPATSKNRVTPTPDTLQTGRIQKPLMSRNQEDRRAALRDYKVSARQPFSLDAPVASPHRGREVRHDSSESFPMFSASGGSSARARSLLQSFDDSLIPDSLSRSRQDSSEWYEKDGYYRSRADNDEADGEILRATNDQAEDLGVEESPSLPFDLDGASEPRPVVVTATKNLRESPSKSKETGESTQMEPDLGISPTGTSTSSSNFICSPHNTPTQAVHLVNPKLIDGNNTARIAKLGDGDVSLASDYQASDFRPIDITKYEPSTPGFAVSAYPVICEAIQCDITQGPACSQFSAYLLSYIHPFFFHRSFRSTPTPEDLTQLPIRLADRLLSPVLSSRIIEALFLSHISYLRSLNLPLPAAEFRKICVEDLDFSSLAGPEARTSAGAVGDKLKLDPLNIKASCSNCKELLPEGAHICRNCSHRVGTCPICELQLSARPMDSSVSLDFSDQEPRPTKPSVAVYCHVCGHSAHLTCMSGWFDLKDTQGECPTPDCGCDCGPGVLREQRIAQHIETNLDTASTRASIAASSVRRDPKAVGSIPAVDKARNTLRKRSSVGFGGAASSSTERIGSGDKEERNTPSSAGTGASTTSVWSKKGTSAGSARNNPPALGRSNSGGVASGSGASGTNGGTSFGRRVRVVEPDR